MSTTQKSVGETTRKPRRDSHSAAREAVPPRRLRSRPCSDLIEPNGAARNDTASREKPASRNALDRAPIVASVEYTTPGSPLDERLRRVQTRALLELLGRHRAPKQPRGKENDC